MNSKISELYDKYISLKAKSTFKDNLKKIRKAEHSSQSEGLSEIQKSLLVSLKASSESLGMVPYDTQLMAALALIDGNLAEMATGEGKTLTVALAASALSLKNKKTVHVVTANPYLASRDADLMRPLYASLGLSVGVIYADQPLEDKQKTYCFDIVYGTSSEFGFDYLRDNLSTSVEARVQKGHYFAIIDEIDSVLIDEARVPLIISGVKEPDTESIQFVNSVVKRLTPGVHFHIDLKERNAELTEQGYALVEDYFIENKKIIHKNDLYKDNNLHWVKKLHAAVKAYGLYLNKKDYLIENSEIILIDQGTGRKLKGRRLSEGLHEALEAKEGLVIKPDTSIQATITFQSYFGLYQHLSGLTGTAATDSEEFSELYNLTVVKIPTHRPCIRKTAPDLFFKTKKDKFNFCVSKVKEIHASGRPILVGCGSVSEATYVGHLLTQEGLNCEVLTAQSIDKEAFIVSNAGNLNQITIATNVAGRGTDISLGGEAPKKENFENIEQFDLAYSEWKLRNEKIKKLGGLFVLATERNFLPRVDNQLAGRCARQGDPGEVLFLTSFNDELFFSLDGNKFFKKLVSEFGDFEQGIVENTVLTKFRKLAQKSHQNIGYSQRKSLVQFDAPLRDQRNTFYALRNELLSSDGFLFIKESVLYSIEEWSKEFIVEDRLSDPKELKQEFFDTFKFEAPFIKWISTEDLDTEEISKALLKFSESFLEEKRDFFTQENYGIKLLLQILDYKWSEHLESVEELQKNINLKAKISQNPQHHFAKEAFNLFAYFISSAKSEVALKILGLLEGNKVELKEDFLKREKLKQAKVLLALDKKWIKRSQACPCGSGLKFKECHGKI